MKGLKRMLSLLLSLLLMVSMLTVIPMATAFAADDTVQVAKIEAWVKGIADPDHSGYYFFSKSKLMTNVIFTRMNKNQTPGWDQVAGNGTNKTADMTLPTGDEDTCGLTGWDNGKMTAGWWDYGNIYDPANWYLDASRSDMDHTAVDWYTYTWLENITLTVHAAVDPTETECGNKKYYTYDDFYFLDDGDGGYIQVDENATIIPEGEGTAYIDEDGETRFAQNPVEITSNSTAITGGWYVASSDVTINSECSWSGDVHLILADNVRLRLSHGLSMADNSSLTIYGQSSSSKKSILDVIDNGLSAYDLTVNSGVINANGDIAGTGISVSHEMTVNGGIIYAYGGLAANDGQEGGIGLECSGTLTVNGGNIQVLGENNEGMFVENFTVNGGSVGVDGSGYHDGLVVMGESFIINGGEIYARGGYELEEGESTCGMYSGSNITINDSEIYAYGYGEEGMGIGVGDGCDITINGGFVEAYPSIKADNITLSWIHPTDSIYICTDAFDGTVTLNKALFIVQGINKTLIPAGDLSDTSAINDEVLNPAIPHEHELTAHAEVPATCGENGAEAYWECETCNKFYSDADGYVEISAPVAIPATGDHTYGDPNWTWETDFSGAKATFTCGVCGDVHEEIAEVTPVTSPDGDKTEYTASVTFNSQNYSDKKVVYPDGFGARLVGHSISLGGDIGVNFYMELTPEIAQSETAYMHFTIPNGEDTTVVDVPVSDATPKDGYYVFKCSVSAKDMNSNITAQIIDGENAGTPYTYSVREYAVYLLENADANGTDEQKVYAAAAPLVRAMLNYGARAQLYFDINSTDLANKDYEDDLGNVTAAVINGTGKAVFDNQLTDPTIFAGATLSLKSETTLSLYFDTATELDYECSDVTAGMAIESTTSGKYQVVRLRGVKAKHLQDSYTVTVKDHETGDVLGTVTYSPMTYCYNVLNQDTTEENQSLQNVCKALYLYAAAADAYFD